MSQMPTSSKWQSGFAAFAEQIGLAVWTRRPDGDELTYISPEARRLLDIDATAADVSATHLFDAVDPDDRAALEAHLQPATASGVDSVFRIVHGQRGPRHVHAQTTPQRDSRGRVVQWTTVLDDVTALHRHNEIISQTHRVARIGGWELELATQELRWTDETYRLHEVDPSEFEPTVDDAIAFYTEDSRPIIAEAVNAAIATGAPFDLELQIRTAAGRLRWVRATGEIDLIGGAPGRLYGSFQDITERVAAEHALRESESRFRTVVEQAADAIYLHDHDGIIQDVNRQACLSLGYERDELLGMHVCDVDADFEPAGARRLWQRLAGHGELDGPISVQSTHRRQDGSAFPVEVRISTLTVNGQPLLVALARDISEHMRAEAALRDSNERFRALTENSNAGIWHISFDGYTRYINPAMCRMLEIDGIDDLRDTTYHRFFTEPSLQRMAGEHRKRLSGVASSYEVELVGARGTLRFVLINGSPLPPSGDGERPGLIGTFIDFTDRKQAERKQRLLMAELDHRVKNNLAAVLSLAQQSFCDQPDLQPDLQPYLERFVGRLRTMAQAHGRLSATQWTGVPLAEAVHATVGVFSINRGEQVVVDGPDVVLPPSATLPMSLTLHELATNAVKYGALSSADGRLTVRWDNDGGDMLQLEWLESCSHEVAPPSEEGLGMRLMRGLVEYELHGRIDITFAPRGLRATLHIPLPDDNATSG